MLKAPSTNFIHLHIRTGYSFFQSTVQPRPLLDRINELGMPALAIVDDGNMAGAMEFCLKGKEQGIKGIIGATVTVKERSETFSLVLLCENLIGYRNLCRIVSSRTITRGTLARHSTGLIALSGGMYGPFNALCLQGKTEAAEELADWLIRTFPERFFIELHPVVTFEQIEINKSLRQLAARLKIPTVATAPCHYLRKEDRPALEALRHLGKLPTLAEAFRDTGGDAYWFMSPGEISAAFADDPESLAQSTRIANLCHLEFDTKPDNRRLGLIAGNPDAVLRELAYSGFDKKLAYASFYRERIEHELVTIKQMGLSGWLLLAVELVAMARDAKIQLGTGRGMDPSSLIAYCLDLTEIDPIAHGLIFERYRDPVFDSYLNLFIDMPQNRQAELLQLITERYGRQRVAVTSIYDHLEGISLILDLGKQLHVEEETLSRLMQEKPILTMIKSSNFSALVENELVQQLAAVDSKLARLLELVPLLYFLPVSATACKNEILVTPGFLSEHLPVSRMHPISRAHFGDGVLHKIGLPTVVMGGMKDLTVIDQLANRHGINLRQIPLDDFATWQLIGSGDTNGVFQPASSSMRKTLRRLQPTCIAELAAVLALHRPIPIEAGLLEEYLRRGNKSGEALSLPSPLAEVLEETRGVVVYWEQIIEIAYRLTGHFYTEEEIIYWRSDWPESGFDEFYMVRPGFIEMAAKHGFSQEFAQQTFDLLASRATIVYPKAYTIAWALNNYRAAYLKAHFPHEFEDLRK